MQRDPEEVEFNRIVGEIMRKLRVKHKMSRPQAAERLGYRGVGSLYRVEVGRYSLPLYRAAIASQVYGVSIDKLLASVRRRMSQISV